MTVQATLVDLSEVVGDMVGVQLLSGIRPGELVQVRPCDINRSGVVWVYTPYTHKTEYADKSRTIAIRPRDQSVRVKDLARPACNRSV